MIALTAVQRELVDSIIGFTDARGFPPSLRDLSHIHGYGNTGMSTVARHLYRLQQKGVVHLGPPRRTRSITVMRNKVPPRDFRYIPATKCLSCECSIFGVSVCPNCGATT